MKREIKQMYPGVFNGLGNLEPVYPMQIEENAMPVIHAPRKIPAALRDKLKFELGKIFFFVFCLSYKNKFLKRKIKIHFLVNTRSEERHGVTESSLQVPLTISFFIYKVQSRYSC